MVPMVQWADFAEFLPGGHLHVTDLWSHHYSLPSLCTQDWWVWGRFWCLLATRCWQVSRFGDSVSLASCWPVSTHALAWCNDFAFTECGMLCARKPVGFAKCATIPSTGMAPPSRSVCRLCCSESARLQKMPDRHKLPAFFCRDTSLGNLVTYVTRCINMI